MAEEVTGNLGGEEIILNNAATETTLQQLVNSIGLLSAKLGGSKGGQTQAQIEREMKRFYQQMVAGNKAISEMTDAERKALVKKKSNTKATEVNTEAVNKNSTAMSSVGKAAGIVAKVFGMLKAVVTGVAGTLDNVAGMGNSMGGAARSFSAIPGVGRELALIFGASADASSRLYETFLSGAQVGANFNGSMVEMTKFATGAGVSLEQFSEIIRTQGSNLRFLGEGTAEGSKRLMRLAKDIRQPGGVGESLARLGFSTQDIIEGISEFNSIAVRGSKERSLTDAQLIRGTAIYLKNLDAIAKVTGKQREEIEKENEDRMRDAQFRAILSRMDPEAGMQLMNMLARMEPQFAKAMTHIIAKNGLAGEEAANLAIVNSRAAEATVSFANKIHRGETITDEAFNKLESDIIAGAEASQYGLSATNMTIASHADMFAGSLADMTVENQNLAKQNTTIAKEKAKQDRDEIEQRKRQGEIPSGLNPALIKTFQENIAETSIAFTNILASSQLMTSFMNSFGDYTKSMQNTLVPLYEYIGEKTGPMISKGFEKLEELTADMNKDLDKWLAGSATLAAAIGGLAMLRGTPANPMFTFNMNEGGLGAIGKMGMGAGTILSVLKGLTLVGGLTYSPDVEAAQLYDNEEFANMLPSGDVQKLTPEEVKEKDRKKIEKVSQNVMFPTDSDTGMLGFTKNPQVANIKNKDNGIKTAENPQVANIKNKDNSIKTAETAIQEIEKQAKAEIEMHKKDREAKKTEKESTEDNTKEVAKIAETPKLTSQDDTEALLMSLNSKMEQLIRIAGNQLTVQKGLGNDLYA